MTKGLHGTSKTKHRACLVHDGTQGALNDRDWIGMGPEGKGTGDKTVQSLMHALGHRLPVRDRYHFFKQCLKVGKTFPVPVPQILAGPAEYQPVINGIPGPGQNLEGFLGL